MGCCCPPRPAPRCPACAVIIADQLRPRSRGEVSPSSWPGVGAAFLPSRVVTLRTLQPRVFVNNHRDQGHKTCSPSDTHLALRSHAPPAAAAAGLPRLGIRRETNSTKYIGKSLIYEVNRTAAVCFHRYTSLPIFIQTRREGKIFIFSVEQLVCAITTTLLAILCTPPAARCLHSVDIMTPPGR